MASGERPPLAPQIVAGSGDDASVTVPAGATATSVDLAIEGVHFRRSTSTPRAIGHKALAAALSDLAAMGAVAGEAYVQLGLPEDFHEAQCLELADGLAAVASENAVAVIGGDLSRSPVLVLAVTVVGHAASADALVRRAGASAGDAVYVTGELGGAAAGLVLLERPALRDRLDATLAEKLVRRQLEPQPRLAAGSALAAAGARAMIDLSDGLGADAGHLARASGVRVELEAERIPVAAGVGEVAAAAGVDAIRLAAGGGEDYELLVSLPPEAEGAVAAALAAEGVSLSRVGRVVPGEGVGLTSETGEALEVEGFDQLRPPPGLAREPRPGEPS